MGRVVDITDKLSFDGNPKLCIKGRELEVNADAPTVLKVMGLMSSEDPGLQEIADAYNLLFPDKSKDEIEKLKIDFKDFAVLVQEAVTLIVGEDKSGGEQ